MTNTFRQTGRAAGAQYVSIRGVWIKWDHPGKQQEEL